MRKTIEDYLKQMEYLTIEDVNKCKWELEDLIKVHPSLDEDNWQTYVFYLGLRDDLSQDEVLHCMEIIEQGRQEEKDEIKKYYAHFEEAIY